MSRDIADDWSTLSPLLDQALDLEGGAQRAWLDELARREPARAATIESLLEEQRLVNTQNFLAAGTAPSQFVGSEGERFGGYTLIAPLGEGGMGSVWLARRSDGRFEGQAAVKFLVPAALQGAAAARFRREGSLLAQLTHPNIARLIDAGITVQGQPYLILEHVDGERIDAYCRSRELSVDARVRLFLDVLAAVAEAHKKLIVHRDIKPSNVFVRRDGVVKLIDFGVAKLIDDRVEVDDPLTREHAGAFTPEYAAPEQIRGEPVTTGTDVYASGVLLFELLTGSRPFSRSAKLALADPDQELEPPLASRTLAADDPSLQRQLQGDLDHIVRKALRFVPGERYGSVEAFADDLRRYLNDEPVLAHADTYRYRARKFLRRHRGSVVAGSFTAVALMVATAVTALQSIEAQQQRDEARLQLRRAQASNDFVTSLLSQAGPDGRGLTPVQLLDRGMDAIRQRYGDDPQFAIDMLLVLSGRYMDLGRTDKEYEALLEAESLARRAGAPATLLNVLCNTVETEVMAGRREAARARMQEARRLLAGLDVVDPMIEVNCLRQEAALLEREDIAAAIELLERAKKILEANDRIYGNVYSSLFSWLSAFNRHAGRYLAAHRLHEQEVAIYARHRREQTVAATLARADLAHSWYGLGEVRRALAMYESTGTDRTALLDLNPMIPIHYGLALSAIGRHDESLALIERGVTTAAAAGRQSAILGGLYARSVVLLRAGRPADAQAALDRYAAQLEPDPTGEARSRALTQRAAIHLAAARLEPARTAADEALAMLGHPHAPVGSLPAPVLTLRSRIHTAAGNSAAAMADATAALSILQDDVVDPDQSATVGAARLALARANLAAGDTAAARRHAEEARRSLANGLGADHPLTRAAGELMGRREPSTAERAH